MKRHSAGSRLRRLSALLLFALAASLASVAFAQEAEIAPPPEQEVVAPDQAADESTTDEGTSEEEASSDEAQSTDENPFGQYTAPLYRGRLSRR